MLGTVKRAPKARRTTPYMHAVRIVNPDQNKIAEMLTRGTESSGSLGATPMMWKATVRTRDRSSSSLEGSGRAYWGMRRLGTSTNRYKNQRTISDGRRQSIGNHSAGTSIRNQLINSTAPVAGR